MSPSITSMWISDVQIPVRGYLVFSVHNTNNSLMFLSVTSFSNGRRTKCSDMAEFTKPFSIRLGKQIEAKCLTICIYKVTKSFLSNFVKSFLKENKHMQGWNPQKPIKLDGNDTTTSTHHPYILCHFATTYTNMLCVCL